MAKQEVGNVGWFRINGEKPDFHQLVVTMIIATKPAVLEKMIVILTFTVICEMHVRRATRRISDLPATESLMATTRRSIAWGEMHTGGLKVRAVVIKIMI